jgi:hypothetical protein
VLKRNLPKTEGIVYEECAANARSPTSLAKCVVKLLNARDRLANESEEDVFNTEPKSQAELYEKMHQLVKEVLGKNSDSDSEVRVKTFNRPKKSVSQRSSLQNLQRIQRYMTMLDKYNKQLVKLNDENAK